MRLYILIASVVIAGAIVGHGILSYISKQNELKIEKEKIETETIMRTRDYYKQADLDICLEDAKAEYDSLWELNSTKSTTPDGKEAREWNSSEVRQNIEDKYNSDREFCLKLYK